MKKLILLGGMLACLAVAHVVFAQPPAGVIRYEVKINLHRRLPPDAEAMKDAIPPFDVHHEELFFQETASLYKPVEEDEDEFEADGGGMRMRFRRPQGEYYTDHALAASIVQQDVMGKKYLIHDSLSVLPWKPGTETKTILGYTCRRATCYDSARGQQVVAWYTDALPPHLGPERFTSLPGGVLQVDVNAGEMVINAQQVTLRPLKKHELKAPTGGERITQAEFQKIARRHTQRMGAPGGPTPRP